MRALFGYNPVKIQKLIISLPVLLLLSFPLYARTLTGKVIYGRDNEVIPDAKILIENTTLFTISDNHGEFLLEIPDHFESITIIVIKSNFYTTVMPDIPADSLRKKLFLRLYPGNENEYILFHLGNILVTSDYLKLPEKAETEYRINRNELVHFQALDLSKALELIPGTELQGNYSLDKVKYPVLRFNQPNSMANSYSLLGTKIVMDGLEIHNRNNLNFNNFAPLRYANNTVFLGTDLRLFPVDNTEAIQVLPDITSAEEGDYLQGVIRVSSGFSDRQKIIKINRTANILHSGIQLGLSNSGTFKQQLYLFLTRDEKNPRISDDSFFRAGFQHSFLYKNRSVGISIRNSLVFSRIFEKYENNELGLFTRDATTLFGWSNTFRKKLSNHSEFIQSLSLNTTFRDDYTKRYTVVSGAILSPLTDNGTTIGVPVTAPYFAETKLSGIEYNFLFKEKFHNRHNFSRVVWSSQTGFELKQEGNAGNGLSIDPLKPPKGFEDTRPRSFSDIPAMRTFSLFSDHQFLFSSPIKQHLGLGVRLDGYNPDISNGMHFRNGFYMNPRIRYRVQLTPHWQIRAGIGYSSMLPALYHLYPRPVFFTILDSANLSQPVVSTYKFVHDNPALKALRQKKFHVALDFIGWSFLKGTLNAYHQELRNLPNKIAAPKIVVRKNWVDWPNTYLPSDTLIFNDPSLFTLESSLWQKNNGIELLFSLNFLEPAHIRIQNSIHYQHSERLYDVMFTYSNLVSVQYQGKQVQAVPVYEPFEIEQENFEYRTFIHFYSQSLGLWVSFNGFFIFKNMQKRKDNLFLFPKYLIINERKTNISENELMPGDVEKLTLSNTQIFHNSSQPFHYYFNVHVTKSITPAINVSFSVNNFLDIHRYYQYSQNMTGKLNPSMNYSLEMQMNLNKIF